MPIAYECKKGRHVKQCGPLGVDDDRWCMCGCEKGGDACWQRDDREACLPRAGDAIWAGTHYRTIVEVQGELEDGRIRILALDERDQELHPMALRYTPLERGKRSDGPKREAVERPKLTPELRQQIADGIRCKRGHDKTRALPNGKPGFYVREGGGEVCRWCKAEDVERWRERHGKSAGAKGESKAAAGAAEG